MSEKIQSNHYEIFVDGGARGNPGEAAIGIVICQNGAVIKNFSRFIGIATNNVAEYLAIIYALQEAIINNFRNVTIYTDSELIYRQIKGEYQVKQTELKIFFDQIKHLMTGFVNIEFVNIPRSKNKLADKLVNQAIDRRPVHLQSKKRPKVDRDGQLLDLV